MQKWPDQHAPDFKPVVTSFFKKCTNLALRILDVIGMGLKLKVCCLYWGLRRGRSDKQHGSKNRWQSSPKRWQPTEIGRKTCDTLWRQQLTFHSSLFSLRQRHLSPTKQARDRVIYKRATRWHPTTPPWKASLLWCRQVGIFTRV